MTLATLLCMLEVRCARPCVFLPCCPQWNDTIVRVGPLPWRRHVAVIARLRPERAPFSVLQEYRGGTEASPPKEQQEQSVAGQ